MNIRTKKDTGTKEKTLKICYFALDILPQPVIISGNKGDTMNAIDMEIESKIRELESWEAELKMLQEEGEQEDREANIITKVFKMRCDHACEKCGNCEDAIPQDVSEDETDLIEVLKTPCDCELLGLEVRHIVIE